MTADAYLARSADYLRKAIEAESPLLSTMLGLRDLMTVLAAGQPISTEAAAEISGLLFAVAPRVAEAVSGRLTAEHTFFALGCGNAAIGCTDTDRRNDLIAYVALLETEIKAIFLRDRITTGGQMDLARMIARNPQSAAPFVLDALTAH